MTCCLKNRINIKQLRVLINNGILRPSFAPHLLKESQNEEAQTLLDREKKTTRKSEGHKRQRRTEEARRNKKKWREFEERFGWVFEKLEVAE